jgi:WD40 repeat protein
MTGNTGTGAVFIAGGAYAGASISTAIGGMGLGIAGTAVGIGTAPVVGAGAIAGSAAYGAFHAIHQGDPMALGVIGMGVMGGAGVSASVGGIGLVGSFGGIGISMGTMAAMGGVAGLGLYGLIKMLDQDTVKNQGTVKESATQVFERMADKVSWQENYSQALLELSDFEMAWEQQFAALEVEHELQQLQAQLQNRTQATLPHLNYRFQKQPKKSPQSRVTPQVPLQFKAQSATAEPESDRATLVVESAVTWKCINTFRVHSRLIGAIAISPDSQMLFCGGDDGNVSLWDLKTGRWHYTFSGESRVINAVVSRPDGKTLLSGGVDRKISSWQVDTKRFGRTFFHLNTPYSHSDTIHALAISSDGQTLASGSVDQTIRLWNCGTGEFRRTLSGHTGAVLAVAFSPDNQVLASGSADKTIKVWTLSNPTQQSLTLKGHTDWINSVAICSNGKILISGSHDCTVKLWNFRTGTLFQTLTEHKSAVMSLALSPDGSTLASASIDGCINLWQLQFEQSGQLSVELIQNLGGYGPIAFSPDGKQLIGTGKGNTVRAWLQTLGKNQECESDGSEYWWDVLGVEQTANPGMVKQAYYRLARLYHPDFNQGNSTALVRMQDINLAYNQFLQEFRKSLHLAPKR